jgi:hypothetical protein
VNYTDITTEWSTITAIPLTDADFLSNLPSTIAYAEGRITRDLDLMAANIRDSTSSTTPGVRNFNLPTTYGTFLIIDGINIITPASTAPDGGTRNALTYVSRDVLDYTYGSNTDSGVPTQFAYLTQNTQSSPAQTQVIFGPWPDAVYRVEVIGKIQPQALSASNANTWLSDNLPELYLAAGMVWLSGYMRNYGAAADDPNMPGSWEARYKELLASASVYQARARFGGASWTPKQVEPNAVPQRG